MCVWCFRFTQLSKTMGYIVYVLYMMVNLCFVVARPSTMVTLPLELRHKRSLLFLILAHPTCGYPPKNAPFWTLPVVSSVCVSVCLSVC